MKKVLAGFMTGALMMMSVQTFASSGFLGKKVDGQAALKIDGEVVGQAIIIKGKSFAPVREITEGVGGEVVFNKGGGAIEMSTAQIAAEEQKGFDRQAKIRSLEMAIESKKILIEDVQLEVSNHQKVVEEYRVKAENDKTLVGLSRTQYQVFKKVLEDTLARLSEHQKELADLKAQLAEQK